MNSGTITKTCTRCTADFQAEADSWGSICDPCEEKDNREHEEARLAKLSADRERSLDRNLVILRNQLTKGVPSLFLATDRSHPAFNLVRLRDIASFSPSPDKPWLGLIGTAGKCKSRIAYLLAADYLVTKVTAVSVPTFEFVAGYQIIHAVSQLTNFTVNRLSSATFAEEARAYLHSLATADLVIIDDIGKGGMPPSLATEMLAILDRRYANQRPTIWTSNSTPQEIAAGMRGDLVDDMRGPFAGRLISSSKIYQFK